MNAEEAAIFESAHKDYRLTADEVAMFERLRQMEGVHNEIAFNLSRYKESILNTRNEFVVRLAKKYGIENPSQVTYDPISQSVRSIFHPELKGHKIEARPYAFTRVASDLMLDAIKKLGEIWKATTKGVG